MTTAIVIGAGIAGPVAAMSLQRAGISATVCEARPEEGCHLGSFLTIQPNGLDALRAVDAAERVLDLGFPTPSMRFRSGSGKTLGDLPNGRLEDGTVSRTLKRSDLYGALRQEALDRGIGVLHGKRLTDAVAYGDGVRASFEDGTTAEADLLVGADGVHSVVRRLIDPGAATPRRLPILNIGGFARGIRLPGEPGVYTMMFGKRSFLGWATAPDGAVWWFANPPRAEGMTDADVRGLGSEHLRSWLLELHAEDSFPIRDLLDATPHPLQAWPVHDLPEVARWHRDRMVILGDAAHAASPTSGQGASLAAEDAVLLAKCLRDVGNVAGALEAFERVRRPRVERVVAHAAKTSSMKVPGPVGRVLRDLMMPFFLRRVASSGSASLAWLHSHHIEWEEPAAA